MALGRDLETARRRRGGCGLLASHSRSRRRVRSMRVSRLGPPCTRIGERLRSRGRRRSERAPLCGIRSGEGGDPVTPLVVIAALLALDLPHPTRVAGTVPATVGPITRIAWLPVDSGNDDPGCEA